MVKPTSIKFISDRLDLFFAPVIKFFFKYGITANHITFSQVPFLAVFFVALVYGKLFGAVAALFIVLSLDTLDGSWARVTKTSSVRGGLYDKFFDLTGIYMLLIGLLVVFPQLLYLNLVLGVCAAFIYLLNVYMRPELYCGVRAFGCLGLFLEMFSEGTLYVALLVSLTLGIVILLYRVVTWVIQRVKS